MDDGKQLHNSEQSMRTSFPLTAFERYVLTQDSSENPCWIIVKSQIATRSPLLNKERKI
jgi:hypothetical protein